MQKLKCTKKIAPAVVLAVGLGTIGLPLSSDAASLSIKSLSGGRFQITGTQNSSTAQCPTNDPNTRCLYSIAGLFTQQPRTGSPFYFYDKYVYAKIIIGQGGTPNYTEHYSSVQYGSISTASKYAFDSALRQGYVYELDKSRHPNGTNVCVSQWLGNIHSAGAIDVYETDNGGCTFISPTYASCRTTTVNPSIIMPVINVSDLPKQGGGHSQIFGETAIDISCDKPTNAIISFSGTTGSNSSLFSTKSGEGTAKDAAYYLYVNDLPVTKETSLNIPNLITGQNTINVKAEYSRAGNVTPTGGKAEASLTFNISYQ